MLYDNIVIGAVRRPVQHHGGYVELGRSSRKSVSQVSTQA